MTGATATASGYVLADEHRAELMAKMPDDFTAEVFDKMAREHGSRALTAAEKRCFRRVATSGAMRKASSGFH